MPDPCASVFIRGSILLLALSLLLVGCETTPTTAKRLDSALSHYEARQYDFAHQQAVEVLRSSTANHTEREQAAYIAGLSAFGSGDLGEAELRLNSLMQTSDRRLLASVQAVLGQIRLEQNRPGEAASLLESAALNLTGEDARQAQRYAAMARQEAVTDRRAQGILATDSPYSDSHFRGGFTLQIGAFQDRHRAEQAAVEARELAAGNGFGSVTIRPSTDARGRSLYLVQFGHFPTRQAAAQARLHMGRLDYIVAPVPRG